MKKIFFTLLFTFSLSVFSGFFSPEILAHEIIPDDIMNEILANENITDAEIDQMFLDRYGMSGEDYTEQKEQENEEGIRESLEGDPEYDAYLQKQYEENEAIRNNPNLANLKKNINFSEENPENSPLNANASSNVFERAQQQELSYLLEVRKQLKNPENSDFFSNTIVIKNAVLAGILHIWGGLDHILFFLTLLLVMRPFKQTLIIISVFTLAHSLTLLLVGSGALIVSAKIIEIIIALSIVYSAVFAGTQILHSRGVLHTPALPLHTPAPQLNTDFKHTLLIVFLFGLFHGMGFAEVFENFEVDFSDYWISLLLYNGGIEIGQLILLAIFFPLVFFLSKKNWGQNFLVLSSFVIATCAVFWLFERI